MQSQKILDFLRENEVNFVEHLKHEAFFTVDDVKNSDMDFDAEGMKTLFIRDDKKRNYFLVALHEDKMLDLKKLADLFEVKKVSFVSESELLTFLSITPGSVSPFVLINYRKQDNKNFKFFIDSDLVQAEKIAAHPNVNTETLIMDRKNFKKYLDVVFRNWKQITL